MMGGVVMINLKLEEHQEISILVAGDFMIDKYLYSTVSRISPEAPVPIAKVEHIEQRIGGAGNVALNIKALGSQVRILTCIGKDMLGDELLQNMHDVSTDVRFVFRSDKCRTNLKTRVVAQNQQLLRYDEEKIVSADQDFFDYIYSNLDQIFTDIQGVILSDYGKGVLTPAIAQMLIREARLRRIPVFVDPKGSDYSKYAGATMCTPNLKELTEASGAQKLQSEDEIWEAAKTICRKHNIQYLLATRSEKGMSLIKKETGEKQDFPAIAQEVSDVTGAGDTVISAMSVCWTAGYSPEACCKLANAAASVVVSKFGAETATVDEVNAAICNDNRGCLMTKKCGSYAEIIADINALKAHGQKIVFTNGCFDLVHAGHISSFRQAKSFGDILVVGINSDASIRRLKGETRPIVSLKNRIKLLEALEMVDFIIPFEEDTPQKLIEDIVPDVLVKGKDWGGKTVAGADFIKEHGGEVRFIDLEQGLSTTAIIDKILTSNR